MKRIVMGSLLAATLLIPAVASAQGVPGGIDADPAKVNGPQARLEASLAA